MEKPVNITGLDAESEQAIHEALNEITKGRTVIMISHRLKTVQSADIIFVFDKGEIVEEGSHDVLLNKTGGLYRQLVKMQSLTAE